MRNKIIVLFMLLAAILPATAQQQPGWPGQWGPQAPQAPQGNQQKQQAGNQMRKFDPQEFIKRIEGYIAIKAGLTKEESDKFFPIYREFKEKQRDLTFKQQRLQRVKPTNDNEYSNTITQIANLSVQIAKLEQTYYPKMLKAIPAKKVYIAIQAENDFHREMVRQPMQWMGGQMPQWGQPQNMGTNNQQRNNGNNAQRNGSNPWGQPQKKN